MKLTLGLAALVLPTAVLTAAPVHAAALPSPGTAVVSAAEVAAPACDGRVATIVGTEADDRLHGTEGADVIVALGGDDVVHGLGGADVVCGGDGADRLLGGSGPDRLLGQADGVDEEAEEELGEEWPVGDFLAGGPGSDHLDTGAVPREAFLAGPNIISFRDSEHGVHVRLHGRTGSAMGEGRDEVRNRRGMLVIGSAHADRMHSGRGSQTFVLGGGDDEAVTGAGTDVVVAGAPRDGDDRDRVRTGDGGDIVVTRGGRHELRTGDGRDLAFVIGGRSAVALGAGNDSADLVDGVRTGLRVQGGPGVDAVSVVGTDEDAQSFLDLASGVLRVAGSGSARATGFNRAFVGVGRWEVHGTAGDDTIFSGGGPVRAFGRGGDDELHGGPGDDLLDGGPGVDEVHGGGGDDTCRSWEKGTCRTSSLEEPGFVYWRTDGRLEQGPRWLRVLPVGDGYDVEVAGLSS